MTERQKQIIEASLYLISQKGIQELTIKNLSKRIGISEPAIYRHYESKLEILLTILDFFEKETEEAISNIIQDSTAEDFEKLEKLYYRHLNMLAENPTWVSVIFSEALFKNEKRLSDKIAGIVFRNEKVILGLVQGGQEQSKIRKDADAKYLTTLILGGLRLLVQKWELQNFDFDLISEGEALYLTVKNLIVVKTSN